MKRSNRMKNYWNNYCLNFGKSSNLMNLKKSKMKKMSNWRKNCLMNWSYRRNYLNMYCLMS